MFHFDMDGKVAPVNGAHHEAARHTIKHLRLDHVALTQMRRDAIEEIFFRKVNQLVKLNCEQLQREPTVSAIIKGAFLTCALLSSRLPTYYFTVLSVIGNVEKLFISNHVNESCLCWLFGTSREGTHI